MDAATACDASLVFAMREMARWQDAAVVAEDADVLFITGTSRFPSPYSNAAFPAGDRARTSDLVDGAAARFADRRYFVWARGLRTLEVAAPLERRGFVSFGDLPGMVIESRLERADAPALEVVRVEEERAFSEFVRVSTLAYAEAGLPPKIAESLLARSDAAVAGADIFLARSGGTTIAAALSITDPETRVGGIYWVGTVPEGRRRGAADAVTRAATNASFDRGARIVTLQASEAGARVYLKMGYREVCRYRRWLSPAP